MDANVKGITRGNVQGGMQGQNQPNLLQLSPNGELLVNQFLPPAAELVRLGKTWTFRNTDLVTTCSAVPTTAAAVSLYNGNPSGGASLVIQRIVALQHVVDVEVNVSNCVIYQISSIGQESAPADETNSKVSMSGKCLPAAYDGKARMSIDVTLGTDNGWFPLGNSIAGSVPVADIAGSIWKCQVFDVNGLIIIPPTAMLSFNALKLTVLNNTMSFAVTFSEVTIGNG